MAVRAVEGKKPYTGGIAIEITEDKVINLRLRDENNLIQYDEGDNEIYVDLQLDDEIEPTDELPVGITTGRIIVDNQRDYTGTILVAKTTSGDIIKLVYADDGKVYIDNGTGTFKQIYLKADVDTIINALRVEIKNYVDAHDTVVSDTAPTEPYEGQLWYDTANDELKSYDGTNWNTVGGSSYTAGTGIDITNDVISIDSTVVATQTDLLSKQDSLTASTGISIDSSNNISNTLPGATVSSTAPSNPSQGDQWYDTTNDVLKVYDGTQWNAVGGSSSGTVESDMKGPCPSGYHVPSIRDWNNILNAGVTLGAWTLASSGVTNLVTYLHIPYSGGRYGTNGDFGFLGTLVNYWTSVAQGQNGYRVLIDPSSGVNPSGTECITFGFAVRPFKNEPLIPDVSWTTVFAGTGSAGIFYNATLGAISISADGTTWYTIADKDAGQSVVWNYGDTLDTTNYTNVGKLYQWGNNHGFTYNEAGITDTNQQDASGYGPGQYYDSSTFVLRSINSNWSFIENNNLWGGITQRTRLDTSV